MGLDMELVGKREKSLVMDRTLSGGLRGTVGSSGCWCSPG